MLHTYIHHKFISIIQYNIISLINEQYDANDCEWHAVLYIGQQLAY